MNNQIISILKNKLEDISSSYGAISPDAKRNAAREILQYFVLDYIYHHPKYSNWVMYGGSVLRICHDLNRMSVDLDFEVDHKITNEFLDKLKDKLAKHFEDTYNMDSDLLTFGMTNNRGLTLKFHIADKLNLEFHSRQIHIKIDLNHFSATDTSLERIPINQDQFSFVIKTYTMSTLMASKIAAIFLRGQRGVGKALFEEKDRDIYDLLWYMGKKTVPDLNYLNLKDVKFSNPKELFDQITIKILNNKKTDDNLKQDLTPLFADQNFIQNWLSNWRDTYMRLYDDYKIQNITELEEVEVFQNFSTDVFSFMYSYKTESEKSARIIYHISDYWIEFKDGDLLIEVSEKVKNLFKLNTGGGWTSHPPSQDKLMQYTELFYNKTENYLKKTGHIMIGDTITTKLIRMTADKLNQKEQILLNKSALLSCELDDLLK